MKNWKPMAAAETQFFLALDTIVRVDHTGDRAGPLLDLLDERLDQFLDGLALLGVGRFPPAILSLGRSSTPAILSFDATVEQAESNEHEKQCQTGRSARQGNAHKGPSKHTTARSQEKKG